MALCNRYWKWPISTSYSPFARYSTVRIQPPLCPHYPFMSKNLKILVVDDTETNLLLVSKFINKLGHQTTLARNGLEAVQKFQDESPDLILMDVMMPEMDGYEATARIRELSPHKWVPIMFLSAKSQDVDHVRGLQVGGDDYITKPVNLVILEARIKAVTRIAEMQGKIVENNEQLERYRDNNERELQLAKHLIEKITRLDKYNLSSIRLWNKPAQHFSGDIFLVALTPADEIHFLLADGTGHGLSAALNVIPLVEVFYSMTAKGFAISSIVHELNRKIKQLMPTERFVATTLVSLNLNERILQIWNGGNPPALFVDEAGKVQQRWKSTHPALGILDDSEFDATTEAFHWNEPGQLYMFSDGLLEAENAKREEFGLTRLEQALASAPMEQRFSHLIQAIDLHMEGIAAHDDVSLAALFCPVNASDDSSPAVSPVQTAGKSDICPCRWKVGVRLTAEELKKIDVVPMMLGWMDQLHLHPSHRGQVFLIFTELFNNALDHGILNLDSALKFTEDGFELYFETRRQRLANLQQGMLNIDVERLRQKNHELLRIHIKDSGKGYDYKGLSLVDSSKPRPYGRGLALVQNLCSQIEHAGNGSEITVYYELN
ncbi:MAG: SpoIIE family protein phosphatase [Sulfurimicrobium sp.]|nr:SpoIIE family protein phosphatase [Sulfurimicrobium sp.]MDP1704847.1 SpoIIE family protein phosphatase [Sulfurimicrobium sp.]MDP2199851.1 SpoIIE family protein phosphatase [Sulfurimicrobium sp.]